MRQLTLKEEYDILWAFSFSQSNSLQIYKENLMWTNETVFSLLVLRMSEVFAFRVPCDTLCTCTPHTPLPCFEARRGYYKRETMEFCVNKY